MEREYIMPQMDSDRIERHLDSVLIPTPIEGGFKSRSLSDCTALEISAAMRDKQQEDLINIIILLAQTIRLMGDELNVIGEDIETE